MSVYIQVVVRTPSHWRGENDATPAVVEAIANELYDGVDVQLDADSVDGDTWDVTGHARGLCSIEDELGHLAHHRIPFAAWDEPDGEGGNGELQIGNDKGEHLSCPCDADGEPILTRHRWLEIHSGGHPRWTRVQDYFDEMGANMRTASVRHLTDRRPPFQLNDMDVLTTVDIDRAVREIAPSADIEVEMTGGGVATVTVRWSETVIEIGPGTYHDSDPASSEFHYDELCVGTPDGDVIFVSNKAELQLAVYKLQRQEVR